MPIIIDQSKDNKSQLQKINKQLQVSQDVDAKWFNNQITGSPTRSVGLFNKENHTVDTASKSAINKVGTDGLPCNLTNLHVRGTSGYRVESKAEESHYKMYGNIATNLISPLLFSSHLRKSMSSFDHSRFKSFESTIRVADVGLKLPRKSPVFNLANLDSWEELSHHNGVITSVDLLVESITLHSSKIKSATAGGNNKFSTVAQPNMYLAIASRKDTVSDDATVIISQKPKRLTDDEIHLTIVPIDTKTVSYFMHDQYVGVEWDLLFDYIKEHYSNSYLNTFTPTNSRGISDIDNDTLDMLETISDLSVIKAIDSQANLSVNQVETIISHVFESFINFSQDNQNIPQHDYRIIEDYTVHALRLTVQLMDHFSHSNPDLVSTDFLNKVYQQIKSSGLPNGATSSIIQESLRLLLSQRLHELEAVKDSGGLYEFKPNDDTITQQYMNDPGYSTQQKRIVTTTDPLVIGQAGAGSGKSHTLIGRIKYLKDQGEDLTKALVLSFTNVAALNINQRFPEIRSETLANMFNQIYQNTYPAQTLSQPSTVANSLKLLEPSAPILQQFGHTTDEVRDYIAEFSETLGNLDQSGFKRVNIQEVTKNLANLIQHNIELTEILLNLVEQTTLELQPIIIHHHLMNNHGQLSVPKEYQDLDYIITDESQDISTFEYILLLELAIHHNAQLLIVGDGSQTLYEFRNSDPKYMNALESSNVFTTFKLDVNFRSSPEVLTFANQFLDVIDANDFAKIQLQASQFKKPSQKSFEQAISVHNTEISSTRPDEYHEALRSVVEDSDDFDKWFRNIMDNDEQVAILGWTRNEVVQVGEQIEAWLDDNGYDREITNIMNDRQRPMLVISNTLSNIHSELRQLNPLNKSYKNDILKLSSRYIDTKYRYSSSAQKAFFNGEFERALDRITSEHKWQILLKDLKDGHINRGVLNGYLTRNMLRIETNKNAMDAYLLKAQEAPDYNDKKIILSTIHGAKGLEFDHTLVLFNESKRGSTSQESLRMMFVALSRAKQSEYIINGHLPRRGGVSNTLSAMFDTPMETAFYRSIDYLNSTKP